jgi:hypothetical protein
MNSKKTTDMVFKRNVNSPGNWSGRMALIPAAIAILLMIGGAHMPRSPYTRWQAGGELSMIVTDKWGTLLKKAVISIKSDPSASIKYDSLQNIYLLSNIKESPACLTIKHLGFRSREVAVISSEKLYTPIIIELGDKHDDYFYRKEKHLPDGVAMPLVFEREILLIRLSEKGYSNYEDVKITLDKLGLRYDSDHKIRIGKDMHISIKEFNKVRTDRIIIVKRSKGKFPAVNCMELTNLRSNDLFAAAGPLYKVRQSFAYGFSNRLIIKFTGGIDEGTIKGIMGEYGLSGNQDPQGFWHLSADPGIGYGICDIAQKLVRSDKVESLDYDFFKNKYTAPF